MSDQRVKRICFDFAAEIYDSTRGFPPGIPQEIAKSLLAALPTASRLLEVGVGTGRIALPLLDQGADLTGIDISLLMLERFHHHLTPGAGKPKALIADAAFLPFPSRLYSAVLFIHVLHLIPDWQAVLGEARRCLRPGGAVITGYDWRNEDNPVGRVRRQFMAIVEELAPEHKETGPNSHSFIGEYLIAQGAHKDTWEASHWMRSYDLAQDILNLARGYYSSSWRLPEDLRREAVERLRAWAVVEFGSLDLEFPIQQKFIWERYRWDA